MSVLNNLINRSEFGSLTEREHQDMLADIRHVVDHMSECIVCDVMADGRMYRGLVIGVRKAIGEACWFVDFLDNVNIRKLSFQIVGGQFHLVRGK